MLKSQQRYTSSGIKSNREIGNVPAVMCVRLLENWLQRIDRCKRSHGGDMNDIDFHR